MVVISAVGIWQYDNIMVVVKTLSTSNDEIAKEMDEGKKNLEEELKKQYPSVISDFSAEEEKQIIKGEITVDEALTKLNERYEETKKNSGSKPVSNAKVDRLIGEKTIELYSLKAYYLGQLGQMEASVKRDYKTLPKDKKNLIGKKEIVSKYMGTAVGLLNQCDAQVEELLSELKSELVSLGADTAIITTIRNAYEKEKNLKKAYYLKLMEE